MFDLLPLTMSSSWSRRDLPSYFLYIPDGGEVRSLVCALEFFGEKGSDVSSGGAGAGAARRRLSTSTSAWQWLSNELGDGARTGAKVRVSVEISVDNQAAAPSPLWVLLNPLPTGEGDSAADIAAREEQLRLQIALPIAAALCVALLIVSALGSVGLLLVGRASVERKRLRGHVAPGEGIGWTRGECIGQGSFGIVYKGMNLKDGSMIAVKEQPHSSDHVAGELSELENEIALMQKMVHENIVRYLGTDRNETSFYIFLECVAGL